MNIYVIPALFALLVKLIVLFYAYDGHKQSKIFFAMVGIFAFHNVCEVLVVVETTGFIPPPFILLSYYVTSIWALLIMLIYASSVSRVEIPKLKVAALSTAGVLTVLVLFSQEIIGGEQSLSYSVTAVRGQFYWAFQAFALVAFIGTVMLLIKGTKHANHQGSREEKDHMVEIQSSYTLLALFPLVIVCLAVMIMMNFGLQMNAAMLIPLATALFLLITLKSEAQHKLTDIRRFLPWSSERKTSSEIMEIFSSYSRDDVSYRDAVSEMEKLLVMHKYNKNGGNASQTAQKMGMPRSSLYSIFNRLSIKIND